LDTSPDGLYKELADWTGEDVQLVRMLCQGAGAVLAKQWNDFNEIMLSPVANFYASTDFYLYDLTQYQTMLRTHNIPVWLRNKIKEYGWKTILDFGGGIGEWSIIAAQEGCNVTYVDVGDSYTMAYARWRFQMHDPELRIEICHHNVAVTGHFDAIIAMDVLEHLEQEQANQLIEQWTRQTDYLFANPEQIKYNFLYPQHITHYNLAPYWEKVEGYLYKVRPSPEELYAMRVPVLEGAEA